MNKSFLILDQIEDSINPEVIELLVDNLVKTDCQVLASTHSPVVLNLLEDVVALGSVIYLYRDEQGLTRSIKLFDIPSMAKKLTVMGVGEAFLDTDLTLLYQEIKSLEGRQRKNYVLWSDVDKDFETAKSIVYQLLGEDVDGDHSIDMTFHFILSDTQLLKLRRSL